MTTTNQPTGPRSADPADPADPADLAHRLLAAWCPLDPRALGNLVADEVTLRSPLHDVDGRQASVEALGGLSGELAGVRTLKTFADDTDVVAWLDLLTIAGEPVPAAVWLHVEDGLVARIRLVLDPRGVGELGRDDGSYAGSDVRRAL